MSELIEKSENPNESENLNPNENLIENKNLNPNENPNENYKMDNDIFDNYILSHKLNYYDNFHNEELNINDKILKGIFSYGFERPSPIQRLAIKPLMDGNDIVIQSHSGTGKTATFLIGLLSRINENENVPQSIIISNTRELASQTFKVFESIGYYTNIKCKLCIGGDMQYKYTSSEINEQLIIGTPGRLCDLISKKTLNVENIKIIVIDEADDVLSTGFSKQIKKIFNYIPKEAQVALVSATIPQEMSSLFDILLKPDYISILIKDDQLTLDGIMQFYINLDEQYKIDAIIDLYQFINIGQGIIYCNRKNKADELQEVLISRDFSVGVLHGDMMQKERELIMTNFRNGNTRILITTDILSRGIDIQQVSIVINFDMPKYPQTYIHRIGRSGRYGRKGVAINFVTRKENNILNYIRKMYNTEIKVFPEDVNSVLKEFS
jgi:translation initiation factor 4A